MKSNFFRFQYKFIIFTLLSFYACESTKYVPENKYFLQKNEIFINNEKSTTKDIEELFLQKTNNEILGLKLPLYFYNLGNKNAEKQTKKWMKNPSWAYQLFSAIFSEKQTVGVLNNYVKFNNWFLKNGQKPQIFSPLKTLQTTKKIKTYFFNKGFFNTRISYKLNFDLKKITVQYFAQLNQPYFMDTIKTQIASPIVKQIYNTHKNKSFLKEKTQYNDENFRKETQRLIQLFRNKGVFHFSKNNISFHEIDTLNASHKTNVLLKIKNRLSEKNGRIFNHPLKVQTIKNINIFTDEFYNQRNKPYQDTISYKGFSFYSHQKSRFHPKKLLQAILLQPNQIYSDSTRNQTQQSLKNLRNFKKIKLKYSELNADELQVDILLTPMEKYSLKMNAETIRSNIKKFGVSGNFSFINRNLFKGAEIFQLSFQGAIFQTAQRTQNENNFNAWETGIESSLEVPRFLVPFNTQKIISKNNYPKTFISTGLNLQKNIGLDKQKFSTILKYSWQNKTLKNTV